MNKFLLSCQCSVQFLFCIMFCICLFTTILYVVFLFSIFLMKPEKHGINIKYTHQRKLFVYVWKTAKQCLPEISLSHILKLKWALKRKIQNKLANGWLCLLQTKVKSVNNVDNKNQGNRKQWHFAYVIQIKFLFINNIYC